MTKIWGGLGVGVREIEKNNSNYITAHLRLLCPKVFFCLNKLNLFLFMTQSLSFCVGNSYHCRLTSHKLYFFLCKKSNSTWHAAQLQWAMFRKAVWKQRVCYRLPSETRCATGCLWCPWTIGSSRFCHVTRGTHTKPRWWPPTPAFARCPVSSPVRHTHTETLKHVQDLSKFC